jgi:hypothetical protein
MRRAATNVTACVYYPGNSDDSEIDLTVLYSITEQIAHVYWSRDLGNSNILKPVKTGY